MVTVVKIETVIRVQTLDQVVSISHNANTLRKSIHPTILPLSMRKL